MTLSDRQRSFNGITLGGSSVYRMVEEEGLEDFEVRDGDRDIPRDDGQIPGLHLVGGKRVVILVRVTGSTASELETRVRDLLAAFNPSRATPFQYRFKNPGLPERMVRARTLRRSRPRNVDTESGRMVEIQIALKVPDPRVYSVEQFSTLVDIFEASGGGFNLPVAELPLNMTAATQALAVANNGGARDAYPVIRFQFPSGGSGTCTGVQLENLTNGDLLDIDTTIVAGQALTADMDALIRATGGSVVSLDGSSRYGDWQTPRDPFRLSPGDNTLKFEVTGTSTDIVCSVQWRSTD